MGKKPIVSLTYENERISIKNSLLYLKCVLRLSFMAVLWVFMRTIFSLYKGWILFTVGNVGSPLYREKTVVSLKNNFSMN